MYSYLYFINIINNISFVCTLISIFWLLVLITIAVIKVMDDDLNINYKSKLNVIPLICLIIAMLLPNKLTMYSYLLETKYAETNNSELYQDIFKLIKQEISKSKKDDNK